MDKSKLILIILLLVVVLILFGCGKKDVIDPIPPSGPIGPELAEGCGNTLCESGENTTNCNIDCAPPFGVYNAVKFENDIWKNEYTKELGNARSRTTIWWLFVEPSKGNYDFSKSDPLINSQLDAGLELIVTIKASSPWATTNYKSPSISGLPKDIEAYKSFLRVLVERYKNKVKYWQIENEVYDNTLAPTLFWDGTKEEYITLLKAAYTTIKETDPDAKVVLQGYGGAMLENPNWVKGSVDFFEYIMRESKDYCDIVDYHQYGEWDVSEIIVPMLKNEMAKNNYNKPIITTEMGDLDLALFTQYYTMPDKKIPIIEKLMAIPEIKQKIEAVKAFGVTPQEYKDVAYLVKTNPTSKVLLEKYQAENIIKRIATSFSLGVSQVYWGSIKDYTKQESPDWYHLIISLADDDGRKKPHFYTYQLLIEKANGFVSAEKLMNEPNVVQFNLKEGKLLIAWDKEDSSQTIDLSNYFTKDTVLVTHIITTDGQTTPLTETISPSAITITETPIFIEDL